MYQRILLPTDGSVITDKAMTSALALAKLAGAALQVLAVKTEPSVGKRMRWYMCDLLMVGPARACESPVSCIDAATALTSIKLP